MDKKKVFILLLFSALFFQTALAEEEQSSSSSELLGKAANFIVLIGSLAYFLYRPLRNLLEARAQRIEKTLKEMEDSRKEAEKKLAEVNERLSHLEEDIARIKMKGEVEAQKEKERIIEEAWKEAERIRRFAEEEIEMLTQAGIRELKEHTAELATALALERIKQRLTPEIASQLIDKSIDKIEKLYEKADLSKKIHPGFN